MAIVAVLVASFSLRENEPNPCNVKLAKEAVRICRKLDKQGHIPVLGAQWEAGLALKELGTLKETTWGDIKGSRTWAYHEIGQYDDGRYLGTKELLDEALPFFKELRATRFVGVANPFIHQPYLYWLARGHGLKLMWRRVRWIGFDPQSTQEWCRSWWRLTLFTIGLALGREHGYNGRQEHSS